MEYIYIVVNRFISLLVRLVIQYKTLVLAVAITAAITLIVAVILFNLFHRFQIARRSKEVEPESGLRRESAPPIDFRQLKGQVVDKEGSDVLYLRKLEGSHFSQGYAKVLYNPMMELEEVKRMKSMEETPNISEPTQDIPLLQEPVNRDKSELEKPLPGIEGSPPSPPPLTPLHQLDSSPINQTPPPAPPPPPALSQKGNLKTAPIPPQCPEKLKPASPPPLAKTRGLTSSHKPPVGSREAGSRQRTEDPDNEGMKENRVKKKLKQLHWDKVMANGNHSMVWNEINNGSFSFDDELIETLFSYTQTNQNPAEQSNKLSSQGSSDAVSSAQIFILDPRKSQNTAIVLKSLAVSHKEILDSLLDGRGLNADTLEKLTKICLTQEETTKILQFSGNPTKLADAESFLYQILKAVPSAFVRFNAMLFRSTYDTEMLHLRESLQTLELACKELRSGGIFFKLLEAILKAGNRMNAGTNRGNAQGFNLTALRRLSDVKSTDGKTTLLHFVVEQVIWSEGKSCLINRNHKPGITIEKNIDPISQTKKEKEREHIMLGLPAVESLSSEFSDVKKAASIDYDSLITTSSVLTTRVDEIKRLLNRSNDVESGGFQREMKVFLEDCEKELNVVREEEKRVMELVRKTTAYYQTGDKGGNPLQLFVIVKDFLNNVDHVCAEIRKNLYKTKAGTSGGSSPPLSPTPSDFRILINVEKSGVDD